MVISFPLAPTFACESFHFPLLGLKSVYKKRTLARSTPKGRMLLRFLFVVLLLKCNSLRRPGSLRMMGLLDSINDKISMENAERLGRIEQGLIGSKHPMQDLPTLPLKSSMTKRLADGSLLALQLLNRDGCVSIQNVISAATADELLLFINKEMARLEATVAPGSEDYDDKFGAVNNRRNRADMVRFCTYFTLLCRHLQSAKRFLSERQNVLFQRDRWF